MGVKGWFIVYLVSALALAALLSFTPLRALIVPSKTGKTGAQSMFNYQEESPKVVEEADSVVELTGDMVVEQVSGAYESFDGDPFAIVVTGPRKLKNVVKHIGLNLVSFRYWYLQSGHSIVDTAIVTFSILSDGTVEGVAIDSSFSATSELKSQLINQIELFEFYQIGVAEKTYVRYPLRFMEKKEVY